MWRRAHQAVAARCRRSRQNARRARPRAGREGPPEATTIAPEEAQPHRRAMGVGASVVATAKGREVGRPPNDHRAVLGGILWVARTGSSWREMPEEYGKWERAYRRHELWVKQGLWQRILRALGEEDLPGPATKEPK